MMISILCFFLKTLVLSFLGSNFIQYVPKVDLILVHWIKEEKEKNIYSEKNPIKFTPYGNLLHH